MPPTFYKILVPGLCTLATLLVASPSAQAGHWERDHYEENGLFNTQNLYIYDDPYGGGGRQTQIRDNSTRLKWTAQGEKVYIDGTELPPDGYIPGLRTGFMLNRAGGYSPPEASGTVHTVAGIASGLAEGWYNVRAVMHWKRDQVNDENGVPHDDPNDNPPKYAWISESSIENGGELGYGWTDTATNTQHNYDEQNPFAGTQFSFDVSHPFHVSFNGTTASSADWRMGTLYLGDRYATCLPAEGDYAYGPTRRFHIKITLPASVPSGDITQTVSSTVAMTYTVNPVTVNVLSRLKGDHDPTDLYTDYNSSATVAVGHKVTDEHEHEADLTVQLLEPNDWGGLQGVYYDHLKGLPGLNIDNKPGVDGHKHFSIFSSDAPALGYTDGNGRVALAKGLSRDQGTNSNNQLVLRTKTVGSSANIAHVWDQSGQWYSGPDGDEDFDPYINYDEATPLTFKPRFSVPITHHNINFLVTKVQVAEWDDDQNTSITRIYTTDATDADPTANPPVLYKADLSEYASFSPGTSGDLGNGVYRSSLTVPFKPEKIVQNVTIDTQDDECYEPHDE